MFVFLIEKDVDEEDVFKRASIMAKIGGLELTLKRLSYVRDLSRAQQLVASIMKLLEYCVKVKINRQYLHKPSVNTMEILLGTLNKALRLERDQGSNSGGAVMAERVLKLMEIILHEASSEAATTEVIIIFDVKCFFFNPNVYCSVMSQNPLLSI